MKPFYTLSDLDHPDILNPSGSLPAKLAVIGCPIAHSASPLMHQAALDHYGIPARYIRLEVQPGELPSALDRLRSLDFIGCNITVPHKFAALEYCDSLDPTARQLGAVNTIHFHHHQAHGSNTDAPGFASAIQEAFLAPLSSFSVCIVGAGGGAGQAIATQCALLACPSITLINRTLDKILPLAQSLQSLSPRTNLHCLALNDPHLAEFTTRADLIVNTTSIGLHPDDPSILPANCIHPHSKIYDTIYKPAVTPLLRTAQAQGCHTQNGFSMLLHQGAIAFQIWFPHTSPLSLMRAALPQP